MELEYLDLMQCLNCGISIVHQTEQHMYEPEVMNGNTGEVSKLDTKALVCIHIKCGFCGMVKENVLVGLN